MVCELAPHLGLFGRGRALCFPESVLMATASPGVCHPGGTPWLDACPPVAPSSSGDVALGVAPLGPSSLSDVGEEEMRDIFAEICLLGFPWPLKVTLPWIQKP